jgi:FlaG/FlaF family flagellin (archaellin)
MQATVIIGTIIVIAIYVVLAAGMVGLVLIMRDEQKRKRAEQRHH